MLTNFGKDGFVKRECEVNKIEEGMFKNGLKEGKWKYIYLYHDKDREEEGSYEKGIRTGLWTIK